MTTCLHAVLANRTILSVSGDDARTFLQGMISNDIDKVAADRSIYAAFLSPQGRFLHDFLIAQHGDELLFDCDAERAGDLLRRLSMYRLRAKVKIEAANERWTAAAVFGAGLPSIPGLAPDRGAAVEWRGGVAFVDPRLARAGIRMILPANEAPSILSDLPGEAASAEDHDMHRLHLGLPDGGRDMLIERTILLEAGFEELDGVSWTKGCFIGQELTTNSRRLVIRKRLMPVTSDGGMPELGATLYCRERKAGEMRSSRNGIGIALVRVENLDDGDSAILTADGTALRAFKPDWMNIQRVENA